MTDALRQVLAAFDPELPLSRAHTLDARAYTSEAIFAAELGSIFRREWLCLARADQLADAGQYVTGNLGGVLAAIVRQETGELAALENVCRHRATRVLTEPCGQARHLRCRYHGWTYDLNGALRGVPEWKGVEDFDRADVRLPALSCERFGPLVFARAETGGIALDEALAPLPDRGVADALSALRFHTRKTYEVACNWKVFIDNFLDGGYHVNTVHPGLAGVLEFSQYRTELHARSSEQSAPLSPPTERRDDGVTAHVRPGDRASYWWIYPNLMIDLYDGVADVNWVEPVAPDRCRVVFDFYFSPELLDRPDFAADSVTVADRIQREDMDVCEEVQRGLHGGSWQCGRFSVTREAGVHHFHRLWWQAMLRE